MAANTDADLRTSCAKCRLKTLLQRLRNTLDNHQPLCQDCYSRLHELSAHYKRYDVITLSLLQETRDEIHRLNVMKVRYEDLVEAFEGGFTKLTLGELDELRSLIGIFDNTNAERREMVVKKITARMVEEERQKNKRKGVIGSAEGLSLGGRGEGKGKGRERAQFEYDY